MILCRKHHYEQVKESTKMFKSKKPFNNLNNENETSN